MTFQLLVNHLLTEVEGLTAELAGKCAHAFLALLAEDARGVVPEALDRVGPFILERGKITDTPPT